MQKKTINRSVAIAAMLGGQIPRIDITGEFNPNSERQDNLVHASVKFEDGSIYLMNSPRIQTGIDSDGNRTFSATDANGGNNLNILDWAVIDEAKKRFFSADLTVDPTIKSS